jgi:hypothetical protein
MPARIASDSLRKEGKYEASSSFLKKSTKKLLFASRRAARIGRVNQWSKSFLVLFSKKNCFLASPYLSVSKRVGTTLQLGPGAEPLAFLASQKPHTNYAHAGRGRALGCRAASMRYL